MSGRETALQVLMACRKDGGWSNGVLKAYTARNRLDSREAALAARLCYGVLQNRGKLDFYLNQLLRSKGKTLHPVVRDILHLGLYQLLEMDKIPDSAAVNEAVLLTRQYCPGQKNAPGFVNGVLRNAARSRETLQEPQDWESLYSHPAELISLFKERLGGKRLEAMLRANNEIAPLAVQVNTLKTTAEGLTKTLEEQGVEARPHSFMENCLILSGTGNLEHLNAFREGLFYVQDPASKLAVQCAELPKNRDFQVLDCCAAPGGKSFAAAIAMGGRGSVTSCDIHPHKIELIQKGAQRLGLTNLNAMVQDAAAFVPQWEKTMDAVLADVPCSGYGIIRKKPDIRYKDPKTMENLPALQGQILANQARYVKPGGVLIYSTCTILRRENEGVVESFLQEHRDFSLEKLPLPPVFGEENHGMLTLIPGEQETDGFFISRLRREK